MSFDSRSRMVSFRLTDEEYDRVRELCILTGTASISQMARLALERMLEPKPQSIDSMEVRMAEVEGRISLLSSELRKLRKKTEGISLAIGKADD